MPATAARAQAMPRVGFLVAGDAEPAWTLFRKEMAALGHIEGKTIAYEFRHAEAAGPQLDAFAAELVGLKVDVLVPILSPAIVAARKATTTLPIVFFGAAPDIGGINNVARPEGNLTGVFSPSSTLAGKGLQLFHSIKPEMKRFAALLNDRDPFHVPLQHDLQAAADAEKIELLPILVKAREELPRRFAEL
ncbi:MAG TPA: ABC transporter substrate binding protein, partial [Reyranella sp.]|nr:ABC transporter substrate binding protein [Reyranella sp.]